MANAAALLAVWQRLNERQRRCLAAILGLDQETSNRCRCQSGAAPNAHPPNDESGSWLLHADLGLERAPSDLKRRLAVAGTAGQGAGSTLNAPRRRGLICVRHERGGHGEPLVYVQLTPVGRQVACAGTEGETAGEQTEP
jgi:hypothetical protein